MRDARKTEAMLSEVLPLFDSLGLNEAELASLYAVARGKAVDHDRKMTPMEQLVAMEDLLEHGLGRIHLHTLGYHLRAGRTHDVESSLRAMVFSSALACAAASKGSLPWPEDVRALNLAPSKTGIDIAMNLSSKLMHSPDGTEAFERDGGAICLPAPIIERPKLTVGLGDCISGSCVAAEKMLGAI